MKTILYVEDSNYNVLLVQAILASRDETRLMTATTCAQGLEIAERQGIDLLLLDLNLPDMRGEIFLSKFRAIAGLERVPVVIVSGESMSERLDPIKQLGVVDILFKPFDIDQFEKIVEGCLKET